MVWTFKIKDVVKLNVSIEYLVPFSLQNVHLNRSINKGA